MEKKTQNFCFLKNDKSQREALNQGFCLAYFHNAGGLKMVPVSNPSVVSRLLNIVDKFNEESEKWLAENKGKSEKAFGRPTVRLFYNDAHEIIGMPNTGYESVQKIIVAKGIFHVDGDAINLENKTMTSRMVNTLINMGAFKEKPILINHLYSGGSVKIPESFDLEIDLIPESVQGVEKFNLTSDGVYMTFGGFTHKVVKGSPLYHWVTANFGSDESDEIGVVLNVLNGKEIVDSKDNIEFVLE